MPNGKPGDHLVTDILLHGFSEYGDEACELLRKIAQLSSERELHQWWESQIGWSCPVETVLSKARRRCDELVNLRKEQGWEMP
jgi:hypothetical protein